jgi:hypothetical protein
VEASTPAGNPAPDSPTNRHGDVDRNGDLVDELRRQLPSESPIDLDEHARLVADVVTNARGRVQHQLRRPWTVTP